MKSVAVALATLAALAAFASASYSTTYTAVTLANHHLYVNRAVLFVNTSVWSTNWFAAHGTCGGVVACTPAGHALSQSYILAESLREDFTHDTLHGDLFLYLYALPPSASELAVINAALATPVSIPPTVGLAYYNWSTQFAAEFDVATFNTTGNAFCVYQTYEAIIEYVDSNGNGHFDLGEAVGTYNLATAAWGAKTGTRTSVAGGNYYVYTVSSSTNDGVVTLSCATSNVPLMDSNGQYVTPNNTKCSLEINNYVFSNANSKLAVLAYTGLADAVFNSELTTTAQVVESLPITTGASSFGAYLTWARTATVNGGTTAVVATASGNITGNHNLIATFIAAKTGTVVSTNAVRAVVFSFQSGANPSSVVWDPSTGFGAEADGSGATGAHATAAVLVSLMVALATAFAAFV